MQKKKHLRARCGGGVHLIRLLAVLLLCVPLSLAHPTPGPILTCERDYASMRYHDYVGFADVGGPSVRAPLYDGNLQACQPGELFSYDGHREFGLGVARLAYESGDGVSSGSVACHGDLAFGHHTGSISVRDIVVPHVYFSVLADHSVAGFETTPDCGDGQVMPCTQTPPPSNDHPFPVNVVAETAHFLVEATFAGVCNPRDQEYRYVDDAQLEFGPGIDGTYLVVIEADTNAPYVPVAGHVYTN